MAFLRRGSPNGTREKQFYVVLHAPFFVDCNTAPVKSFKPGYFQTAKQLNPVIDINVFMGSWTLQMGYPIVNVQLIGHNKVNISQAKYKFPGGVEPESPLG